MDAAKMDAPKQPLLAVDDPVLHAFAEEVGAEGPVAIEGNRTRWHVGGDLAADARVIKAPTGMVAYAPEEMTAQVRVGTPVAEFHAALAEKGQRSALPERGGTVGGAIAVGQNALSMLGRGRVRTSVLQIRYISSEGRIISGGGPTVKNVTGFDLPRLMVGSLGTLGLLAEAVIRTNPIPEVSVWLRSDDADPFGIAATVLKPSALLWDGTATWVELEGHGIDVAAETAALAASGTFREAEGPPALPAQRWSLKPSELLKLTGAEFETGEFVASVGTGTVWAAKPQPPRQLNRAAQLLTHRMKAEFDPPGRLNPGRTVETA